jgi:hypothetical protein
MSGVSDIYRNRDAVGAIPLIGQQRPSRYPTLASDANLLVMYEMEGTPSPSRGVIATYAITDTTVLYNAANGKFGKGRYFDGASSKMLTAGNVGISGNAAFSYMMWILPTAVNALQVICDSGANDALKAAAVCIDLTGAGDLGVAFAGGNSVTCTAGVLTAGIWQHIAVTKAAGAINTTTNFYVNGVNIALAAGAPTGTPNITNSVLTIGCSTVFGNLWYTGAIDDFMVFNDVVTGQEISEYLEWCKNVW